MWGGEIEECPDITIEGGDNKYTPIAAASILAKVARDQYIEELVKKHPELEERYGIAGNKGYGAKKHMDGIKEYGITKWHRKTYGICRVNGTLIQKERLKLVPHATMSIDAKNAQNK